ncbi:MAG: zinc-finger domain-containing protein [Rickettsiaceae bacterium]
MPTPETKIISSYDVHCSGKEFPYDHPKIYLEIDKALDNIICPYCSKEFKLAESF